MTLRAVEKRPVPFVEGLGRAKYHGERYRDTVSLINEARRRREREIREKRKALVLLAVVSLFAGLVVAQSLPLRPWVLIGLLGMSLVLGLGALVPVALWGFERDAERVVSRESAPTGKGDRD